MSLCYALAAEGAATCCLNWCVSPEDDREVHKLMGLKKSERVIMLMALGYAACDVVVPKSPRRSVQEVLSFDGIVRQPTAAAARGETADALVVDRA